LFSQISKYLIYYSKANTIYNSHSPILYEFSKEILEKRNSSNLFKEIEALRASLKIDNRTINFTEFGAGSSTNNDSHRSISQIAKSSLSLTTQCRQLHNIIRHYQPEKVLEMGTSLGISTSYMALGKRDSRILTLEGDKSVASIARQNFESLNLKNITILEGRFSDTLSSALDKLKVVDVAFIDGNHRYQPTVDYFNEILGYTSQNSLLIFDDIHWSNQMEKAWQYIKEHEATRMTIDLFHMGVVFLNPAIKAKQHHTNISYKYKPWKIGLFG